MFQKTNARSEVSASQSLRDRLRSSRQPLLVTLVTIVTMVGGEQINQVLPFPMTSLNSGIITILSAIAASLLCTYWLAGNKGSVFGAAAPAAKRAFFSEMSRELRNPLNVVLGMADVLCETELSREQLRYVETLRRSGAEILKLIEGVLVLDAIEKNH